MKNSSLDCNRTWLKSMKHSCLRDVVSETHSSPRRQFDVLRGKIDLWAAPKNIENLIKLV